MRSARHPRRLVSPAAVVVLCLAGAPAPAALAAPAAAPPAAAAEVPPESVLARVGNRLVTAEDFRQTWYKLDPDEKPRGDSLRTAHQIFLDDLVTRELLAIEAMKHPRPPTAEQRAELARMRETLMKNELYSQEVARVVRDQDIDLAAARKQMTRNLELRAFRFDKREDAQAWYTRIVGGTPVSRLEALAEAGGLGAPTLDSLGVITREAMRDTLAGVLFELAPGRLSVPLPTGGRWVLYQVLSVQPRVAMFGDDADLRRKFGRILEAEARQNYRVELRNAVKVEYDFVGCDTLLNRFLLMPPRTRPDEDGVPVINVMVGLPHVTPADSELVLARTKTGAVTARTLLRFLADVPAYSRSEVRTRGELLTWVDRVAFDAELLRRAEAAKLERVPRVRRELERRRESFLVGALFADSVGAHVKEDLDSLRAEYDADPSLYIIPEHVQAWVVVVESRGLADSLGTVARGDSVDLGALAKQFSMDPATAQQGGLVTVDRSNQRFAEVVDTLFATPATRFGGPVQTTEGWVVFRVQEHTPAYQRSFNEALPVIRETYQLRQEERLLQAFLGRLRRRTPVEVFPERLAAVANLRP